MTKVLITGGAGFIGYHLANLLIGENYSVDIVDNLSRGKMDVEFGSILNTSRVRFFNIDLIKPDGLNQLDKDYEYIYHFAAIIGVSNVLKNPYKVLSDNVLMFLNIIDFARKQQFLKRLVFASTSEVYAGTLKYFHLPIPTPEDTPLALTGLNQPRTSYMLSKIYGEALCQHSGLPFTIIRPHNIYGPRMGMAHVIPELLKKAHYAENGGDIEVFSVDHTRTFCYVEDAVRMIKIAAELKDCENQTINVGNQFPELSIKELAEIIIRLVGKNLNINRMPETFGSPPRRCPDMTKTIKLTGYKSRIDIEKGINLTYKWYREHMFSC